MGHAQDDVADESPPAGDAASAIDADPASGDDAIEARLERIFAATRWFGNADVAVEEGIVFLRGLVATDEQREWAERVAQGTDDVVAVINEMEVESGGLLDLSPAWTQVTELATAAVRHTPMILVAAAILLVALFLSRRSRQMTTTLLKPRLRNPLLRNVTSRIVALAIFLLGLYLVLSILGLTGLAVTIIGGTGLAGLVVGFAFRDIAENFLASVLLSIQKPFATGDFIEVTGCQGFVQSVNTRSTLLMTREGNHVQIPNATIYKNTITNYTANPLARYDFSVGIGYDDSIGRAQQIGSRVLSGHPAILTEPEPLVLVEALGPSTVNLRAYFWIDVTKYSHMKVLSAAIRLTKQAFAEAGISMPDEAREVVFPDGVPVTMQEEGSAAPPPPPDQGVERARAQESSEEEAVQVGEGNLRSEADAIDEQARRARKPEGTTNLLED